MTTDILIREDVSQLLQEANCPAEFTQQFLAAIDATRVNDQFRLLRSQRLRQLERLHLEEKRLDRLDFLRYALEKQQSAALKK